VAEAQLPHSRTQNAVSKRRSNSTVHYYLTSNGQSSILTSERSRSFDGPWIRRRALLSRLSFPIPNICSEPAMSAVVQVHNQDAAPQIVGPQQGRGEQMGEYFLFVARDTIAQCAPDGFRRWEKGTDSAAKKAPIR